MLIVRIIEIQHQDFTLRPGALNADTEESTMTRKTTKGNNMVNNSAQSNYNYALTVVIL